MPIVDPFDPPPQASSPTIRAKQRTTDIQATQERIKTAPVERASLGVSMESGRVNQAQGRTALAVDVPTVDVQIAKRRADSQKAQIDALEAKMRSQIPGGFATEGERQTAFNYGRMKDSQSRVAQALAKDPSADAAPLVPELLGKIPFGVGDILANTATDPERRRVVANRLDMLDSALWLSTGAAYNKQQLETLSKAYFPQVGDDMNTRLDKAGKLNNLIKIAKSRAAMGLVSAAPDGGAPVASEPAGEVAPGPDAPALPAGFKFHGEVK